jgi:hypothetical protein
MHLARKIVSFLRRSDTDDHSMRRSDSSMRRSDTDDHSMRRSDTDDHSMRRSDTDDRQQLVQVLVRRVELYLFFSNIDKGLLISFLRQPEAHP